MAACLRDADLESVQGSIQRASTRLEAAGIDNVAKEAYDAGN